MLKKIISLSLFIILSCTALAQQETVGFEFNQHYRAIDTLNTSSGVWSINYRNELPTNTRIAFSLGLDNVKLFEDDSDTDPMLKSSNQIFVQLELRQIFYYFYIRGAAQYYKIKGNAYEATGSNSSVRYHNNYDIYEFPLSAGFTVPTKYFDVFIGVNKTFFYGSNKKDIFVNNSGTETKLGSVTKQTFQTDLDIAAEGALIYHITQELDLELAGIMYSDNDFSFRLSLWGPLKRMY